MPKDEHPLIAGFIGGLVSTTLLLPLDVIKVRLQVNEASSRQARLGTIRLLRGILKHEGVTGIFQGWAPAVVGSSVSWGGYFYLYEGFKRHLVDYKQSINTDKLSASSSSSSFPPSQDSRRMEASTVLTSWDNFVLACTAGGLMVLVTNPIWLIKTRMQLQMKHASQQHNIKPYKGLFDAASTIIREEGYFALYRGCGPALLLTSHGGVQFVVYEFLRKHFHYRRVDRDMENHNLSVWDRLELSSGYLLMGATAKIVASCATYPLQVIKARMQQRSQNVELTPEGHVTTVQRQQYTGIANTIRRIWINEGASGFFKGVVPNSIRVAPQAAITFMCYEGVMDWLDS